MYMCVVSRLLRTLVDAPCQDELSAEIHWYWERQPEVPKVSNAV